MGGNLEVRGILTPRYPKFTSPDDRVNACEATYKWCHQVFGELFISYSEYAGVTCDSPKPVWVPALHVNMHRYDLADKYRPDINQRAVISSTYITFLLLVLVIWWLIVIQEFRSTLAWWGVMVNISSRKTIYDDTYEGENLSSVTISGISVPCKAFVMFFIVVPRTMIIVALAYIGTDFLIVADSFGDLILNSVALGFLVEIDDMLFAGVCNEDDKEHVTTLQDITARDETCFNNFVCTELSNHTSIPLILFVTVASVALLAKAYYWPSGKEDLRMAFECICHAEGANCIAASILGGLNKVPVEMLS